MTPHTPNPLLLEATDKLLQKTAAALNDLLSRQQLHPHQPLYRRRIVESIEQTPTGPQLRRSHTQYFHKPDWASCAEFASKPLEASPEFTKFLEVLTQCFPARPGVAADVAKILQNLVAGLLAGRSYTPEAVCSLLHLELNRQPFPAQVEIEVYQLDLHLSSFEVTCLDRVFHLRQIAQSDFERELSQIEFEYPLTSPFQSPNAVLEIRTHCHVPLDLQKEAGRALVLLRLFRVAAVEFGIQRFHADTLLSPGFFGTCGQMSVKHGPDRLALHAEDLERFTCFWTAASAAFPPALNPYESDEPETPLRIAYDRYCDSLFPSGRGDRQIAFAVMALEALFLGRDEKTDLKYRLAMRAAKCLSLLQYQSAEVFSRVREAYDIRSMYVHGGHLSAKERSKCEKRLGIAFGQLRYFLLDYVRATIVACIIGRTDKDTLLAALDDSLLTPRRDADVQSMLGTY